VLSSSDGPQLIIAGAGTGKTTTIIQRIADLISSKKAKPGEILALTFTDKAAEEMEVRVDQLVPYGYVDVSISTFHAFGDRVLREHAIDLGLTSDYRVLSVAEQLVFFREHIFKFPLKQYKSLSDPTRHIEALLSAISRLQDEDISFQEYLKWAKLKKDKQHIEIAQIYKKYQELKAAKGLMDFADQVGLVLKLFRKKPKVLKKFQEKYKYILVDEFQDTNHAQFELLRLLVGKKANLTVVGDDDQAIYKFRGAAISNILNFEKVYKKSKKIVLTKNYRSSQTILDTAYRLIRHNNPDRLEIKAKINKKLKAVADIPNKKVVHLHYDKVTSEADGVAAIIKEKGYKYSDCAILVRANADAEPFRRALNMQGILHKSPNEQGLYTFPEVKLAISFLRVIGDLADSASLYNLAVSEIYRLNPLDLQKINTFASRRNYTLHQVFSHLDDGGEYEVLSDIKSVSRVTIKKIMDDIKYYLNLAKEKTTGEVLYVFLKKSGFLMRLTKEESVRNEQRLKNIARFFERVREFREIAEHDHVSEFIKHLNVMREAGENPETVLIDDDLDAVNILSVHKAKGLEFRVVFMVCLVTDKFPVRHRKDPIEIPQALLKEDLPNKDFHMQEERRLFYVGMTRAKEELYLTSALDYGGKRSRKVSRFVLEAMDQPKADLTAIKTSSRDQIELFAPIEIDNIPILKKIKKGEPLRLSFYQIDDYLTCPLKYKYVHLLRVPLLPNHAIIYGAALHNAVQVYDNARLKGGKFTQKNLINALLKNWSSEGFISREHEEARLEKAKQALKLFYKSEKKSKRKVKSVEESFSIPKQNIILRGRFDRVDELAGKTYIVDFKSSEVNKPEDALKRAKNNLQLSIYALAWKEKFKELPHRLELYFLESGLIGSVEKTEKDIDKAWDKVLKVEEGVRKSNFVATPNYRSCSYCAYNEICPASAA